MTLRFVDQDDPVLREVVAPYDGDPRFLRGLAVSMWEAMRRNSVSNYSERRKFEFAGLGVHPENGCGLAAPQVGERARLLVVDLRPARFADALVCVNPVVVSALEPDVDGTEGCLSWSPRRRAHVRRPGAVRVEYLDLRAKVQRRDLYGLLARAFQHELDHLDGRCVFAPDGSAA